jgi:hypothetical protein
MMEQVVDGVGERAALGCEQADRRGGSGGGNGLEATHG